MFQFTYSDAYVSMAFTVIPFFMRECPIIFCLRLQYLHVVAKLAARIAHIVRQDSTKDVD